MAIHGNNMEHMVECTAQYDWARGAGRRAQTVVIMSGATRCASLLGINRQVHSEPQRRQITTLESGCKLLGKKNKHKQESALLSGRQVQVKPQQNGYREFDTIKVDIDYWYNVLSIKCVYK